MADQTVTNGSNSQYQLAYDLFADLMPQDKSVTELPTSIGFKRNNIFTEISNLTLGGRRFLDVAYFLVSQCEQESLSYYFDADLIKWLGNYNTRNTRYLNETLRKTQKAAIEVNDIDMTNPDKDQWISVPLMGVAAVSGGKVMFEISERLRKLIKNPEQAHFLSLSHVFSKIHAKLIFDYMQQWLDHKVTPWMSVEEVRNWLECTSTAYKGFNYLNNRALKPAIEQIKEVTGMVLEMDTKKLPKSKKVSEIRFIIKSVPEITTHNREFTQLKQQYEKLRLEFGLSSAMINEVMENSGRWSSEYVERAMEYTRERAENGQIKTTAANYLMDCLRKGHLVGDVDRLNKERRNAGKRPGGPSVSQIASELGDKKIDEVLQFGQALYDNMTPSELEQMLGLYAKSIAGDLTLKRLGLGDLTIEELMPYLAEHDELKRQFVTHLATQAKKIK